MTKYYSLLIREPNSFLWGVQFGDYSKAVVEQERRDSYRDTPKKNTLIITTGETQAEIDMAVKLLNDKISADAYKTWIAGIKV
jgi:hypothetical protein